MDRLKDKTALITGSSRGIGAAIAALFTWLFHRQVLREKEYLGRHYGQAYAEYRGRVRRYF
jgi:protein-S-isoprenylcysteine O-methyltransferase Ste14